MSMIQIEQFEAITKFIKDYGKLYNIINTSSAGNYLLLHYKMS